MKVFIIAITYKIAIEILNFPLVKWIYNGELMTFEAMSTMLGSITMVALIIFVKYFKGLKSNEGSYEYEEYQEEDENGLIKTRTMRRAKTRFDK